jgi:hypothetical protein
VTVYAYNLELHPLKGSVTQSGETYLQHLYPIRSVRLRLILRPTVSRPFRLGVRHPFDVPDQILIFLCF